MNNANDGNFSKEVLVNVTHTMLEDELMYHLN